MTDKAKLSKDVVERSFRDLFIRLKMHQLREDETALQCQCGRMLTKRHCPRCGSSRGYALSSASYECHFDFEDGVLTDVVVSMFRCTNCNRCYDEIEWLTSCKAQPKNAEMRAAVLHKLRLQERTAEERKAAVRDAMNKFGPTNKPRVAQGPNEFVGTLPSSDVEDTKKTERSE